MSHTDILDNAEADQSTFKGQAQVRTALVDLCSRGLFYGQEVDVEDGCVRVKLLSGEEELAFGGAKGKIDVVLDAILSNCLGKRTRPSRMVIGDRIWILMNLRAHTYGSEYKYEAVCPMGGCDCKFEHNTNLLKLEVKYSDPDDLEPFQMELPDSHEIFEWRLLRGEDETAIRNYAEKQWKKGAAQDKLSDPRELYRMARAIVSINGEDMTAPNTMNKRMEWLRRLSGMDFASIRTEMAEVEPGPKLSDAAVCPRCGTEFETPLVLNAEFFRPTIRGIRLNKKSDS